MKSMLKRKGKTFKARMKITKRGGCFSGLQSLPAIQKFGAGNMRHVYTEPLLAYPASKTNLKIDNPRSNFQDSSWLCQDRDFSDYHDFCASIIPRRY